MSTQEQASFIADVQSRIIATLERIEHAQSEESEPPLNKSKLRELEPEEKEDVTVSVTLCNVLVKMPIVCLCQRGTSLRV